MLDGGSRVKKSTLGCVYRNARTFDFDAESVKYSDLS